MFVHSLPDLSSLVQWCGEQQEQRAAPEARRGFCSAPVTEEGLEPGGYHTSREGRGESATPARKRILWLLRGLAHLCKIHGLCLCFPWHEGRDSPERAAGACPRSELPSECPHSPVSPGHGEGLTAHYLDWPRLHPWGHWSLLLITPQLSLTQGGSPIICQLFVFRNSLGKHHLRPVTGGFFVSNLPLFLLYYSSRDCSSVWDEQPVFFVLIAAASGVTPHL